MGKRKFHDLQELTILLGKLAADSMQAGENEKQWKDRLRALRSHLDEKIRATE